MPEPRRSAIRSLVRGRRPKAPRRDDDHDDGLAEPVEVGSEDRKSRIVDSAIYVDGSRVASPGSLAETFESLRQQPDGMAWIGLYRLEEHEVESLASEFQLHPLAVEDAIHAHQRPKIERYDHTLFVVLRPARYLDATEDVEFCVALRSALLRDRTAHLFAVNGIVADSDPAEELAETELKLGALLPLLAG